MPASTDPAANVMPIDVELYLDIHDSGALDQRRVELVDGELIEMHATSQRRSTRRPASGPDRPPSRRG